MKRILLPLALFLAVTAVAGAQTKYRIRFDRPQRISDLRHLEGRSTTHQISRASVDGRVMREIDSTFSYLLSADVEKGKGNNLYLVVRKCLRYEPWDTVELLPPGTRLTLRPSRGGVLHSDDPKVDTVMLRDLSKTIIDMSLGDADADVGTTARIPVGGSWKVNAANKLAGAMTGGPMSVEKRDIKATGMLESVADTGAVPSMRVRIGINLDDFSVPAQPKLTVISSNMKLIYHVDLPLDESKGVAASRLAMTFEIKSKLEYAKGRPPADYDASATFEANTSFTYR